MEFALILLSAIAAGALVPLFHILKALKRQNQLKEAELKAAGIMIPEEAD